MWTRKGELDGVPHEKGDALRTWEVIAVSGTAYSYDLEQQAEYAVRCGTGGDGVGVRRTVRGPAWTGICT